MATRADGASCMSAHEDLQRQLLDSVAARARLSPATVAIRLRRWWRRHGALATVAALAALVIATSTPHSPTAVGSPQGATLTAAIVEEGTEAGRQQPDSVRGLASRL